MKKITKVICVCLLIAGIIFTVSCTRGSSEAAGAGTVEKLTLWVYDDMRIDALNQLGRAFEAEFGIGVEISIVDLGQIRNQFLLATGGAEAADLAIIPHDNLGPLVENSKVMEVNIGGKRGSYLTPALEGFTYNGRLYGVPLSVENIGFFYNTQMVPTPPETWDEAVAIAQRLINEGRADYMMGLPDATYNIYPVYDAYGGAIFGRNPDGSLNGSNVLMADQGFVAGLDFLVGLVRRGLVPEAIDWDGAHVLFESGRAPFCPTGPWALNRFKTEGVPYGIASFPAVASGGAPGNPFMGVQGMIINSTSPRSLMAHAFAVDFIARQENMMILFQADGRPSAWRAIFDTSGDADSIAFNAAGVSAVPMPSIPEMGYVWDAWVAAADLAFSGQRTAAEALQNAKTQIESMGR